MTEQKEGGSSSPSFLSLKCWDRPENLSRHIRSAVARGLPELQPAEAHDGHMVIVACGPSLADHIGAVHEHHASGDMLVSVNAAHDWLIERGIVPRKCVLVDSIRKHAVTPHKDVEYLLASQCHPDVFDLFGGSAVTLWHAWVTAETTGEDIRDILGDGHWVISGGATATLRCLTIGKFIGYRRFTIYGMDSSFKEGARHVTAPVRAGGVFCEIEYGGRVFPTAVHLAAQADQFERLYMNTLNDCRIEVVGDGLVPWICYNLNKLKYRTETRGTIHAS